MRNFIVAGLFAAAFAAPVWSQPDREVAEQNNLKDVALGMHLYHDDFKKLPPPAAFVRDGRPLLSWRVAILPYIQQKELFQQFKLNEPWDSNHNKKLIPKMPTIFCVDGTGSKEGMTHLQLIVGLQKNGVSAVFKNATDTARLSKIPDGNSQTLLVVQGESAVPWTKPEDLKFDELNLPKLLQRPEGYIIAYCNGNVRLLPLTLRSDELRAVVTKNGGEKVDLPD